MIIFSVINGWPDTILNDFGFFPYGDTLRIADRLL
jgi:hypothetical protein